MGKGSGRGAFNRFGLLSPALSSCGGGEGVDILRMAGGCSIMRPYDHPRGDFRSTKKTGNRKMAYRHEPQKSHSFSRVIDRGGVPNHSAVGKLIARGKSAHAALARARPQRLRTQAALIR